MRSRRSHAACMFSSTLRSSKSSRLWNERDRPARDALLGSPCADVDASEDDPTPARLDEAGDGVDGGRLSRTVRSDQAHDLAGSHLEAQALQRLGPAERDGDLMETEHGAGSGAAPRLT